MEGRGKVFGAFLKHGLFGFLFGLLVDKCVYMWAFLYM